MIDAKDLPAPADRQPVRRALLSAYDKSGLAAFARRLHAGGVELISTGGTARALREADLPVTDVAALTGSPEILGGRVKSLHPAVHGALLARRNDPDDAAELEAHGIAPIDLVVCNLYPFEEAVAGGAGDAATAENIDIGGPAMVRAAAKNFFSVAVVTDPADYDPVADELEANDGHLALATRRRLAGQAFRRTARYDDAIATYFEDGNAADDGVGATHASPLLPETLNLHLPRAQTLRYGENPHQRAALYGHPGRFFEKLHGKDLSFNNLMDLSAALFLINEFAGEAPTCAILKHTNPCGAATAETLEAASRRAFATDRQSPFGGIVVTNRALDRATAEALDAVFTEIVIAPDFEEGVIEFLKQKKNRRLVRSTAAAARTDALRKLRSLDLRSVAGGVLAQERDPALALDDTPGEHVPDDAASRHVPEGWHVPTERAPTEVEWQDLRFAWRVVKHVKSNAIVYARERATLGIGAGQMSRIDASEVAVMKGRKSELSFEGAVVASDAFFPFADGLEAAVQAGARAAIQPGGSIRDDEVIAAADACGVAMVLTGTRHFRH